MFNFRSFVLVTAFVFAGCDSCSTSKSSSDAATDATVEASSDSAVDATVEASSDSAVDASVKSDISADVLLDTHG